MDYYFVASTWRRLFARGIDQVIRGLFYLPFGSLFFKLFMTSQEVRVSIVELFVLFMVPAIYEFVFLVLFQATPGKWLLGLKVAPFSSSESKLDLGQCFLRSLVGQFTFFFSWAIFAVAFFRYDRTHLADWIAGTRVVQSRPRLTQAKVRPILGLLFVILYSWEGLVSASSMIQKIDWSHGQADLRTLIEIESLDQILEEVDFEE